ncbi:MAG: hypothetical protein LBN18_04070 [Dysgonamonadaceae bacterium]|jgi:DNA-binding NarL/FixJ family response regulator|nr:hypothetical protein [Dysgonamonadaceae bacterium]
MNRKFFLAVLSCFVSVSVWANHPMIRNFTREIYKSGTQNWGITQQSSNIMYFANNAGLLEFDGKNWRTYPVRNATIVRSVLADDEVIYAGATNEFGYYSNNDNGLLQYYSLRDSIAGNVTVGEVWQIHKGKDVVYFQSDKYVFEYDGRHIKTLPFFEKINTSAFVYGILFVAGEKSGLCMLNGELFIPVPGAAQLRNKEVCAILPYTNHRILLVTNFHGVYLFDGHSIRPFQTGIESFLVKNQIFCAAIHGDEIVYGTVQCGIVIQNLKTRTVRYVNTFSGLQNNTVLSLAYDRECNLWLGLDNGIDYVVRNTPVFNLFGTNNRYGAGYTSFLKDQTLYLGTNQGLYQTSYPLKNNPEDLSVSLVDGMRGQVWFLGEIDQTLFCGSDQGLFVIQPGGNIEKIEGVSGTWVVKKLRNHPDLLLGCSYQSLFILRKEDNRWKFSHYLKGDFEESSNMFEQDNRGNIWFSHYQKGLYRLELNDRADSIVHVELYDKSKGLPTNYNNTFYKVRDELIFSSEDGFFKYNATKDLMEANVMWDSLFVKPPNSIRLKESPTGDVWCVSGAFFGVARRQPDGSYQMDSVTYRMLQPKIILGFEHFDFVDKSNVLVSTVDGFSWIDLQYKVEKEAVFQVFIRTVTVTQQNAGSTPLQIQLGGVGSGRGNVFKRRQNFLRFEYVAPVYLNEDFIQYSYKLENYDENWSDWSYENTKEYTMLPKGHYKFLVRAKNTLDQNVMECYYEFTILPAWYETNFAYVVYAILLIALLLAIAVLLDRRSQKAVVNMRKTKELEMKEQKKSYELKVQDKEIEITELQQQQLEEQLQHKSSELANSVMHLVRKNEILQHIYGKLDGIRVEVKKEKSATDRKDIVQQIFQIEQDIQENIKDDDSWKRFEANFDVVHHDYLKRLLTIYPNLSQQDRQFCACLKLGFSSKDIAALLNITLRSVEAIRYRLRKKMDLDKETSLAEFLQGF